jgi:LDH2 family malate/lactate/ureidoglycolate dehydrogenase
MSIAAERLERWTTQVFAKEGLPEEHARTVAKVLVWANLRAMDTHGVMRVPRYVDLIRAGDLNPRPAMTTRSDSPGALVLEADRAAGPVAMVHATEIAMEKAKAAGIGFCLVRGTTHTAALGYYTQLAAEAGMAAIAFSASSPLMAYHGARAAGVSTAPLALAVPGERGPIALDMASSLVSMGTLMQSRRTGKPLPPDSALDAQGHVTTDAKAAVLPLPLGGAKGSGLALLFECFASLLAGHPLLAEALEGTPLGRRHRQNGAVIAIDLPRFIDPQIYRREAARLGAAIKALPPQPGMEILLPGERGARAAAAREREGIPLPKAVHDELRALARAVGLEEPA